MQAAYDSPPLNRLLWKPRGVALEELFEQFPSENDRERAARKFCSCCLSLLLMSLLMSLLLILFVLMRS